MTKNLAEGEPAKLIFFFTIPLLAGNIFQQLYALIDTLLVGRFLGVKALASVGCTGALMFLVLGFIIGFTTGLTIHTGQRFGAGDRAGVRRSAAACAMLSLLASIVLTALGLISCRALLVLMQTPPEILEGAYDFIRIVYGGISMFVFFQTQMNLMRALGNSRTPTLLMGAGVTINIVFELIAIPLMGWGIPGAAAATIASQFVANLIGLAYIWKRVPDLHTRRRDWIFSRRICWEHLRIALPMGFQSAVVAVGAVILQVALNGFGPAAIAAFSASQKIESIAMMPMMSFGIAMAAYTAQNYGAGKFHRIADGVRKCAMMSVLFSVAVAFVLITFGTSLMALFVGAGEAEILAYGQEYLVINGVCYWILSLLFVFRYTLQGLGQSVVPTIAGIMELVMRAAAAIVLCDWLGYVGACMASPMAWIGSCVPLAIAYVWTRRSLLAKSEIK